MNNKKILIIGAGAMGSTTAFHLAQRGCKPLVIEQFRIAHDKGSSHGETRMIRKAYFEHPNYVPLLMRAYENWAAIERLSGESLYRECGIVYDLDPKGMLYRGIKKSSQDNNIELIEGEVVKKHFSEHFHFSNDGVTLFEPKAGYLFVEKCVRTHIEQAEKLGAIFQFNEKVLEVRRDGSGYMVVTDKDRYLADTLVLSAGAWASTLLPQLQHVLRVKRKTLWWFKKENNQASAPGPAFFFEIDGSHFYGFPDLGEGLVKCAMHSGGEYVSEQDFHKPVTLEESYETAANAIAKIRQIAKEPVRGASCLYTMTEDEHFLIGPLGNNKNLLVLSPCSGHGFKFSSVMGEIAADLIIEGKTALPIDFLSTQRYSSSGL